MIKEAWEDIEGYEGLYQVSTLGRVKNSRSGRILKGGKLQTGIKYYGARECARQTGLNQSNIIKVLKGRYKTTGGYTFKYKGE